MYTPRKDFEVTAKKWALIKSLMVLAGTLITDLSLQNHDKEMFIVQATSLWYSVTAARAKKAPSGACLQQSPPGSLPAVISSHGEPELARTHLPTIVQPVQGRGHERAWRFLT